MESFLHTPCLRATAYTSAQRQAAAESQNFLTFSPRKFLAGASEASAETKCKNFYWHRLEIVSVAGLAVADLFFVLWERTLGLSQASIHKLTPAISIHLLHSIGFQRQADRLQECELYH